MSVLDGERVLGTSDLPHRIVNVSSSTGSWIMAVSEEPRARFGEAIELRAADVSRRGNWLNLWLHWHALSAPGLDTKYFVHLLDAQGNVVAQNDGIHIKYTRPSSEWRADEMLSDLIEMPLWNLSPGEYRIAVGLTNPGTHGRIPASDAAGNAQKLLRVRPPLFAGTAGSKRLTALGLVNRMLHIQHNIPTRSEILLETRSHDRGRTPRHDSRDCAGNVSAGFLGGTALPPLPLGGHFLRSRL